ncbi:MAG: flavodoxin [Marinobacter psychrophilus]|jgi:flavodoxin
MVAAASHYQKPKPHSIVRNFSMQAIRILVGSVYGGALMSARAVEKTLTPLGYRVTVLEEPQLSDITDNNDALLVCTSTTGQGELPSNILQFYVDLRDQLPQQPGRPFGSIVLGDSSYGDTFCGAGELIEEALYETSARKVGDTLRIDAMETMEPEIEAAEWAQEWVKQLKRHT